MTANENGFSYTVSRILNAPVDTVWDVWTQAHHYEGFFHAPKGSGQLDVRPGGKWRITTTTPDGTEVPMTGSYVEVVDRERLVTTMDIPGVEPVAMTLTLAAADGGGTEITLSQTLDTAEARDGAKQGSEMLLQWCADYIRTL